MAATLKNKMPVVLLQLRTNTQNALQAVGQEAVSLIRDQMLFGGYYKAPYDTGRLFRSIDFSVIDQNTVYVGTDVPYGKYVHEGTYKMGARPFIRDALLNHKAALENAAANALKKGF